MTTDTQEQMMTMPTVPSTAPARKALDELDESVAAYVAGMTRELKDRDDRIAELEAAQQPASRPRFPGDPGPGQMIVGAAVSGRVELLISRHEQPTGVPVAFRQYWNDGVSDLAVPNGPVATAIKRDTAAGRITVFSVKLGVEALAAKRYRTELVAAFLWALRLRKRVIAIVQHEVENDWKADQRNLPAMARHAADYRAAQRWVRECFDEALRVYGQPNVGVLFAGSLMTYSLTAEGLAKFGPFDQWNPGLMPDGSHVWHVCGLDHYTEPNEPMRSPKLMQALAALKAWGVVPGITELGVRAADPKAAEKINDAHALMLEVGGPLFLYYDSAVNSTGAGWALAGKGLDAFHAIIEQHAAAAHA